MFLEVNDAAHVVEVSERRFAIGLGVEIEDARCRPAGPRVNPITLKIERISFATAVQDDVAASGCDDLFDEPPREEQASVIRQ